MVTLGIREPRVKTEVEMFVSHSCFSLGLLQGIKHILFYYKRVFYKTFQTIFKVKKKTSMYLRSIYTMICQVQLGLLQILNNKEQWIRIFPALLNNKEE